LYGTCQVAQKASCTKSFEEDIKGAQIA
jgi:hypothetical protein